MSSPVSKLRALFMAPAVVKLIRYSLVSVISVVVTLVVQVFCFGVLRFGADRAAITASLIAAIPSYFLNRMWVWGKSGRSHMRKEVIPFWIMVVVGLVVSTGAASVADNIVKQHSGSHTVHTVVNAASSFLAFAVLWVGKYIFFNRVLFVHREEELDPALDGRTGLPT